MTKYEYIQEQLIENADLRSALYSVNKILELELDGIDAIEDLSKIEIIESAIYVRWCDSFFTSYDEAVELLKEHPRAFEAAIEGYLKLEDRGPAVYNNWLGLESINLVDEVDSIQEYIDEVVNNFDELVEVFETTDLKKINEYYELIDFNNYY